MAHPYLSGDGAFAFDYARFTVDHVRGCAVVVATGEIDLGTSPRLCEALDEAGQESDRIIIDLTDVTFLDSSGMAAMVKALNRNHHRQRGTLCLVGPTGVVLRALEVTDLVSLFPIYSSCDEALGHLAWDLSIRRQGPPPPSVGARRTTWSVSGHARRDRLAAMLPWSGEMSGRIDEHVLASGLLRDNPLGDPYERPLWVHLPPRFSADQRYPVVYAIQGYTGHLTMWRNRTAFRQPVTELFDAVLSDPGVPDVLVVYVDAWTAYGGSQFVDSPGTGRYHSYLCEEVVPFVDATYPTLAEPRHRAISGKSSGGFGAMITPMLRPDLFGALATHAGDALYEYCYIPEFAQAVRALREYDGDIWLWWEDFRSRVAFTKEADQKLLMMLGVAACFSADADGTVHLPFDPVTGVLVEEVWQRWLALDPVRMLERPDYARALTNLSAAWIDGGTRDEWYLDLGAAAFRDGLRRIGVPDDRVHFELFEAGHGAIEYRYPLALAWLAERLAP